MSGWYFIVLKNWQNAPWLLKSFFETGTIVSGNGAIHVQIFLSWFFVMIQAKQNCEEDDMLETK